MPDEKEKQFIVAQTQQGEDEEQPVDEPAKLLRIGSMVREMLNEVRRASIDEEGRRRMRDVYDRSVAELKKILSEDLKEELDAITLPFEEGVPTESELRVTQAQLTGWLEGLFHGIQAALVAQQMQAQQQLGQLRHRELQKAKEQQKKDGSGQYL